MAWEFWIPVPSALRLLEEAAHVSEDTQEVRSVLC